MNLARKALHILFLLFLALPLFSCKEGCVEADEFDSHSVVIESNPVEDGIFGYYDGVTGGQRVSWHNTGLRSNGDMFLIQISGSWTALQGLQMNADKIDEMNRCNFCTKRYDGSSPNCICFEGQDPTPEKGINGVVLNVDCNDAANQENPEFCTCTKQHGLATDYGAYHFPLDILDKNENARVPDKQNNCRYDRGMGAYIALWGNRGVTSPLRAYHLFTQEEICNVVRKSNGECVDEKGRDVTRYVFRSANNRIFVKDDNIGNQTIDYNGGDDIYHNPNEYVKVIMYDRYYSDNQGRYNLKILRGVGDERDPGLLEYLVRMVEGVLIGEINEDGVREGGIMEFMYKAIVQDTGFALAVQVSLALYIALFGAAHLFGVVEISSKKEIMSRVLKISLIVFFISEGSWYFYNSIVVSFFKDSMDYVVGMMMDLQDAKFDATSMVKIAQMDRAVDVSNSTRFSYVDLIIKNLMSEATTKKIFGLFFTTIFGTIYIAAIYALIFFFIYVMLFVASMYIANLVKIVFVLSLGPIFMVFSLFTRTQQMFKNWLGFLGGRSLEVIMLFTILYLFLTLIDRAFTDMLFYRTCAINKGIGPVKLILWIAEVDRSFIEWVFKFFGVGALIFITNLVIQKVPDVAGSIISIGGVGSSEGGGSGMAGGMLAGAFGLGKMAAGGLASGASFVGRYGIRGATHLARKSGVVGAWNKAFGWVPFNSPRTFYRHSIIDGAIRDATKQAAGLSGQARDKAIRENAVRNLQFLMQKDPTRMALAGVDMKNISERLDKKLLEDPLKKFIAKTAKERKHLEASQVRLGKEGREDLRNAAKKWARENLYGGAEDMVDKYLGSKGGESLLKSKSKLSTSDAAKIFARDEEGKKRYLQHLADKEAENKRKKEQSQKHWHSNLANKASRFAKWATRDTESQNRKKAMRQMWQKENDKSWWQRSRFNNSDALKQNRLEGQKSTILNDLTSGHNAKYSQSRMLELAAKDLKGANYRDLVAANRNLSGGELLFNMAKLAHLDAQMSKDKDVEGRYEQMLGKFIENNPQDSRIADAQLSLTNANKQQVDETTDRFHQIGGANIEAAEKAYGLVVDKFEVQFGQSITDALLQAPDLGLKAGNVALGVAPQDPSNIDYATLNALKANKNQLSAKLKMDKMKKQINEFKLSKLQDKERHGKLDASESRELQDLRSEVETLERDIKSYENEVSRLDSDISRGEQG